MAFAKVKFNSRQNESFAIFLSFINTTPIEPLLQKPILNENFIHQKMFHSNLIWPRELRHKKGEKIRSAKTGSHYP